VQINDDAVGRSVEETLRVLKAFQWADSHVGEVRACMPQRVVSSPLCCLRFSLDCHHFAALRQACPASWKPGDDTIRANPYESREYFRAHYSDK
jgi:peroxiredoxin (alkyl hydroperoxide reductase subunit C)